MKKTKIFGPHLIRLKRESEPAVDAAGRKAGKPYSKYGPFEAIFITLAIFFGSQILAGIVIGLYIAVAKLDADTVFDSLSDSTSGQFLFLFLTEAVTMGVLYLYIRARKVKFADIGLGRKPKLSDPAWAAVTFGAYFATLILVMMAVGYFVPSINLDQEQQIGFDNANGVFALGLVFIALAILPPVVEEIMIRGYLYSGLRSRWTKVVAALVASLIFGAAHLQIGSGEPPLYVAAIDTFVLSMFLIGLREKTGSLWAGMIVHALKNTLAFFVLFIVGTH